MGNCSKALQLILTAGVITTLAGCGGNDSPSRTTDTDTNTTTTTTTTIDTAGTTSTTSASSLVANNPPHSIVITYPSTDAVQDVSWGYYRRKVSALVQDAEGHPVADGTVVYLGIIDSVLARGSVPTGGITATTTFTDATATLGDGATPTQLDAAYVKRNEAHRFIQEGDLVLLTSNAEEEDKIRYVNADTLTATSLTTSQPYTNSYPSTVYPAGDTNYVVGASLLGAQVAGEPQGGSNSTTAATTPDGTTTPTDTTSSGALTAGVATTVDGVAHFRITYPSSLAALSTGCNPSADTRIEPTGSAQVYLTAWVNDTVTTIDTTCLFAPITDGTIELTRDSITASSSDTIDIRFRLRDGGDGVPVPFWGVDAYVTTTPSAGSPISVQAGSVSDPTTGYVVTDATGWATVRIDITNALSADTAIVTLSALNTSAEISISVVTNSSINLDTHSIVGTAGNGTYDVNFTVSERGDTVVLPAWAVSNEVTTTPATDSNLSVQVSAITIDQTTGQGTATISVNNAIAGDSAIIELTALDATAEINFSVP